MTILIKYIEKIRISWLSKILVSLCLINDFACFAGAFVLPFIKYPERAKIPFLIFWIYAAVIFCVSMIVVLCNDLKTNQKKIDEYKKDKVVYIVGRFGALLYFVSMFCLIFLARNNYMNISLFSMIGIAVLGLLLFAVIIALLTQYKNNYVKMAKDTINFLLAFFVVILFSILMLAGIFAHGNENFPKYFSEFLVGISAIPLLLGGIYLVCKMFLSSKMLNEKSDALPISIVLFIAIGIVTCILLRYAITDDKMQEITTTIFASILGGAITLAGVAWTIKKGDMDRQAEIKEIEHDRKEEDKKKNKPYLCINTKSNANIRIALQHPGGYGLSVQLLTDAIFIFKGVIADDKYLESEKLIPQKESFHIELNINDYKNVSLVGCDVLDNYYKFDLEFYMRSNTKLVKSIELPIEINIKDIQV